MPKCLLDMDGVLVDFVGGALDLLGLDPKIYDKPESLGNWDIVALSGMEPANFWEKMGYDFWLNLPWTKDGQEILNFALAQFGFENICLLTSPCTTEGCMEGKLAWIKKHIPEFGRRYLIGPSKEFCVNPDHYLFDDRDENIEKFVEHGGKGVLVPRPWNKLYRLRHDPIGHIVWCFSEQ